MKTVQRILAGAVLAASLAGTAQAAAGAKAGAGNALSVVKTYMAGWNAHDPNLAAMNMDFDVEYFDATVGQSSLGVVPARDNVIKFFMQAFPDLKWQMEGEPLVGKDGVAFRWVFTGTNTGIPVEGDKPTGKPIELHGLSLIKVKGGRIVYQGDYYDALTFRKQLGLSQ